LNLAIPLSHIDQYWSGFAVTLKTSVIALILSFIIGFIIASLRVSGIRPLEFIARWYVEFLRNTPLLIQVFFFYYALPQLHVSFYTAAYIAEIVRAGIQSIDKGQLEAARSSGLSYVKAMIYVILPQAFRIVIPPLGTQFINLVKNSAVLAFFAGMDIMYLADSLQGSSGEVIGVYTMAAVFYLIITIPLTILVNYLEKKLAY
jgi:aspartate/glutamate/glutamine transport system permease protein